MKTILFLIVIVGLSSASFLGIYRPPIKPIPTPTPTPIVPAQPEQILQPMQPSLTPLPTQDVEPTPATYEWKNYTIGKISVKSNDASYGPEELKQDITKMITLGEGHKLTNEKIVEVSAAIMSAAQRYYPELPTKNICRIIISTIKTESSLNPNYMNGAFCESGKAYGLMQITPKGEKRELDLFKDHHNFSNLFDYETGKEIDVDSLKAPADLYRPWINIHIGVWIQSNLGRTGGMRTSQWGDNKQGPVASTVKSGLGSWTAGPASEGEDSYSGSRDFVSNAYFKDVLNAASLLFEKKLEEEFLENMKLKSGVIYYKA